MRTPPTFKPGDHVAYSAAWLRDTGQQTGDMPAARGVVVATQPLGARVLVSIDWSDDSIPSKVIDANLAHVGPNSRFCQV